MNIGVYNDDVGKDIKIKGKKTVNEFDLNLLQFKIQVCYIKIK